jgi:hypothetical protein
LGNDAERLGPMMRARRTVKMRVTLLDRLSGSNGLIPHRQQAGIRAMSPLKLYEYLAAGRPVVSVDLPPIHGVDDERVLIVRPEDWQSALARATSIGHAAEEHRLQFVAGASWIAGCAQ